MTHLKTSRLAGIALLALTLSIAAPAMAFDTGGGGGSTSGSSSGGGGGNGGGGGSTMSAPAKPAKPASVTLALGRADIKAKDWTKAIADLKKFVAANPSSADGFNLLGYSYRNAGNYDLAGKAYTKALKLDPKHTGALEYQGILFIKLGQMDKAKANLDKIKTIGGAGSEEYKDLAKAIG